MTDKMIVPDEMSDLELITRFLNGQLDPESDARVRDRLEHDANFKELAAPLLVAWSVPPQWKQHPRPAGEAERMWDEFTKRVGFVHQRRKARRRNLWIIGIALFAIAVSALAFRDALEQRYVALTKYEAVADSGREMRLHDSAFVTLQPGARVRSSRERVNPNAYGALLTGSARFRVEPVRGESGLPRGLVVQAGDADVATAAAIFDVATRGDTTFVQVIDRSQHVRRANGLVIPLIVPEAVVVTNKARTMDLLVVRSGERARLVRGRKPELLVRAPTRVLPPLDSVARPPAHTTQRQQGIPAMRIPSARITISSRVDSIRMPSVDRASSAAKTREPEARADSSAASRLELRPGEVALGDGIRARPDPDASLQTLPVARADNGVYVRLRGSARFVVLREVGPLIILTGTVYLAVQHGDFAVTQHGDTTDVDLFAAKPSASWTRDSLMMSGTRKLAEVLILEDGNRARSIHGGPAFLLPPRHSPDSARIGGRKP